MKAEFDQILKSYLKEKLVHGDTVKKLKYDIERDVNQWLKTYLKDQARQYKITFSYGQGNLSDCPWLAIMDRSITTSVQRGIYLVYLFSKDMDRIYLTLNQGYTQYKTQLGGAKGKQKLKILAEAWRKKLYYDVPFATFDEIDLKSSGDNPRAYEMGTICSVGYEVNQIPDDEKLYSDLLQMISLYQKVRRVLGAKNYEEWNDEMIADATVNHAAIGAEQERTEDETKIANIIATEAVGWTLNREETAPLFIRGEKKDGNKLNKRMVDYAKRNRRQEKIGLAGELLVLEEEKKRLKELNSSKVPEHTSVITHDREPYDIKSYDEDGEEIYIEVKTTTFGKETPFFITASEVEWSKKHPSQYYLYRVFEIDEKNKIGKYYVLNGDISQILELKPIAYFTENLYCDLRS